MTHSANNTPPRWHVYLLRCADDTLYCGVTTDLARRLKEHNAGTGAKYTRARLPVTLEASAPFADRSAACSMEYAVKQHPRADKIDFLLRSTAPDPAPKGAIGQNHPKE